MPRYFFDVQGGREIKDTEGSELDGRAEVREVALKCAGELLRYNKLPYIWSGEPWRMIVTDEAAVEVLRLSFSAHETAYRYPANGTSP